MCALGVWGVFFVFNAGWVKLIYWDIVCDTIDLGCQHILPFLFTSALVIKTLYRNRNIICVCISNKCTELSIKQTRFVRKTQLSHLFHRELFVVCDQIFLSILTFLTAGVSRPRSAGLFFIFFFLNLLYTVYLFSLCILIFFATNVSLSMN